MRKQPKKQPANASKRTEKKFIHMNGKKGHCLICNSEKHSVVNGVCFDCITKDTSNGKRD